MKVIGTLEQRAEEFVREVDGRVEVDWEGLVTLRRKLILESDGSRSWLPLFENLLDYLTEKGILTYSTENSWTIVCRGMGIDLSPKKSAPHSQLYFTTKEEAEAYNNAFYRNLAMKSSIERATETI